jgi:isopentenyldiphosphate isomerase
LTHRAVHILVFDKHGRLYVQKRSKHKFTSPLCYDSSSSGHLDSGESYDKCATRELQEELGLGPLQACPLRRLFKIRACKETGWEHVWVYACQTDSAIHPDPYEIESGRFWMWDEVMRLVRSRPADCADGFVRVMRELMLRGGLRLVARL